jgi:hypothetical protein
MNEILNKYFLESKSRSFAEWLEFKLGELGFAVKCTKDVRSRGSLKGVSIQWNTKIAYKNKTVASENDKCSKELDSLRGAIALTTNYPGIPEELRKRTWDLEILVLNYTSHQSISNSEEGAINFVNQLKKYDKGEPITDRPLPKFV